MEDLDAAGTKLFLRDGLRHGGFEGVDHRARAELGWTT
jgi:hypothetical protein